MPLGAYHPFQIFIYIYIKRGEELVISNAYPFPSLRKFEIWYITRVVFGQGAMPNLQTLRLGFKSKESSMGPSSDFAVGFENLSSLEDIKVSLNYPEARPEELKAAKATIQNAVDMNKNKPSWEITPKVTSILFNNAITFCLIVQCEITFCSPSAYIYCGCAR